ncbi:MAG TPA: PfkB family carbohydrate kinase, partial [Pirellulales bacterium]|nr:PfkB family carbohydrate kinase [Pirellulales bacterium]
MARGLDHHFEQPRRANALVVVGNEYDVVSGNLADDALGDLILDRYTFGDAERVSQEAPVILLRADKREARLGGAANVCHMLRGLEARVTCAGVVGGDADGELVRQMLEGAEVDHGCLFVDDSRPTTVKERFIGRAQGRHPHQMLRVDSEVRDPIC